MHRTKAWFTVGEALRRQAAFCQGFGTHSLKSRKCAVLRVAGEARRKRARPVLERFAKAIAAPVGGSDRGGAWVTLVCQTFGGRLGGLLFQPLGRDASEQQDVTLISL